MDVITKKKRTRLSPDERRRQLLNHGITIFAREGINRAGHANIADIADVSIATVFNYFPTKEDLVAEVLEDVTGHFRDFLVELYTTKPQETFKKQLENTVKSLTILFYDKECKWPVVWFEWSTASRDEVFRQHCTSRNKVKEVLLDQLVKYNITDESEQEYIFKTFIALIYIIYYQASTGVSQEEAEDYTTTFFNSCNFK